MNTKRLTSVLTPSALAAAMLVAGPASAAPPEDLFEAATPPGNSSVQLPPQAMKGRAVNVHMERLGNDSLNLNLLDGVEVIADRTGEQVLQGGRSVWLGKIRGEEASEVILAVSGGAMSGHVRIGGEVFEIGYGGGSTHQVRQIDPSHSLGDLEVLPDAGGELETTDTSPPGDTTPATAQDAGTQIDVMVVYTPRARNNAGGVAGIEAKITNAVASANQAYVNSGVAMHLNLVHAAEVAYTEDGSMSTSLSRLQGTSDGYMDAVHQWRDQYGADQVVLISADNSACGIGYLMNSVGSWFAPYAFSVVHDDSQYFCLGNYTFAHELGHNQGSHHDRDSASSTPAYDYSYGYRLCVTGGFRTVMAYSCTGAARVGYFSNPDVYYGSEPTGNAGFEDNALSLNNTAATVASWRASKTVVAPTAPAAPSNLSAPAKGTDFVQLSWSDNADDESGFKVQRAVAGGAWSDIATLGRNATGYTDTGLAESTLYQYRVYAYSSVGDSDLSNTVQVETDTSYVPTDVEAPVPSLSLADGATLEPGRVRLTVSATDNVGFTAIELYIDGKLVAYASGASLTHNWNTRKLSGDHGLEARASDAAGNEGSLAITVTIGSTDPTNTDGGDTTPTKKVPPGKNK